MYHFKIKGKRKQNLFECFVIWWKNKVLKEKEADIEAEILEKLREDLFLGKIFLLNMCKYFICAYLSVLQFRGIQIKIQNKYSATISSCANLILILSLSSITSKIENRRRNVSSWLKLNQRKNGDKFVKLINKLPIKIKHKFYKDKYKFQIKISNQIFIFLCASG